MKRLALIAAINGALGEGEAMISDNDMQTFMLVLKLLEATPPIPKAKVEKLRQSHREAIAFNWTTLLEVPRSEMHSAFKDRAEIARREMADHPLSALDVSIEAKRLRKQNFRENLDISVALLTHYRRTGELPAPSYANRVAVLLRKANRKDLSDRFEAAYKRHVCAD